MSVAEHSLRLAVEVRSAMQRLAGRTYRVDLNLLGDDDLRELLRFARDAEDEKRSAERRAALQPWRHW